MTPDPKRTAQASRLYAALLKFYPAGFQQEYGEALVQHFRDVYRDALAAEERFPLVRFWLFICFDFLSSFLMEVQEKAGKMFTKKFFVVCAIVAGLITLLIIPYESKEIVINDKVDLWMQLLFWPLFFGSNALALFGITKVSGSHLIFKILVVIMLVFAVSTIPIPVQNPPHGLVGRPAFTYLFANEDQISGFFMLSYILLTLIIAIAAFMKKQWIPGACLLAINLPLLIPNIAYTISENSPIVDITWNMDWYNIFMVTVSVIAWFVIAWWFYRENATTPNEGALEAA